MSLSKLLLIITLLSIVYTAIVVFGLKKHKKIGMTFLQSFAGILFIISGWVKIVDPMGTGFKMQQYFAEFDAALEPTWLSFINGLWPILNEQIFAFSVFMIVLEIVLGISLLIGAKPKWTAWIFFLIVIFFTILTGFTFLTGYVPTDKTFFQFSEWGAFAETNMRVTDCGCFGDFIKLDPRTSFIKDLFLLIPSIIFLFAAKHFHQLLTPMWRSVILIVGTIALILYALSNFVWNLPDTDFRPFKEGVNIAETKARELESSANVEVLYYKLKDLTSNKIVEIPYNQYLTNYTTVYSDKTKWETLEQVLSEPTIEPTKMSEFVILGDEGYDISEDLLAREGYQLMIVSYKLKGEGQTVENVVQDTIYRQDTTYHANDTLIERKISSIDERKVTTMEYSWSPDFVAKYKDKITPLALAAKKAGVETFAVAGAAGIEQRASFSAAIDATFPIYEADDILLKTIVRSNPGILLLQKGKIVKKWHINKLPSFSEMQNNWLE